MPQMPHLGLLGLGGLPSWNEGPWGGQWLDLTWYLPVSVPRPGPLVSGDH